MSIGSEISEWLNKQHSWIREAAHRLLCNGTLDETDLNDLMNLVMQSEPEEPEPRTFPGFGRSTAATPPLRLESIGPIEGIDALNPTKPLTFGTANLAVVFGSNGSGKSGFSRIISRACGKAHSISLKPNVYSTSHTKQECTLSYSVGNEQRKAIWPATADPVPDLIPVNVFDSECGRLYLEKETQLMYEPPELSLFTDLASTGKRLETAFETKQSMLVREFPALPAVYASTSCGRAYLSVSKDTTAEEISTLCTWTTDDEAKLTEFQTIRRPGDAAEAVKRQRTASSQTRAIVDVLEMALAALKTESLDFARKLHADARMNRNAATEGAKVVSGVAVLEGVGTATWRAMWDAARAFSKAEAYPLQDFPNVSGAARCVLCHQNLDNEAQGRLQTFEAFIVGQLEKDAKAAEQRLLDYLKTVPSRPEPDAVITACHAAGLPDDMHAEVEDAWAKLEARLRPLRQGDIPEFDVGLERDVNEVLTKLQDAAAAADAAVTRLDIDTRSAEYSEFVASLLELEARKWISQQVHAVVHEVDRLKKHAEYDEWVRKTSTKGISRKAGELSEALITEACIKRFNEELEKLGAKKIRVELMKSGTDVGRVKHVIRLQNGSEDRVRASDILSEGERRIVALAAFIADVVGSGNAGPMVFDDPISSLDQTFEEKVVTRLIELSKDRQVLIFTHRLSLLGLINDLSDAVHEVNIRREPWGTGQPGEVPIFGKKPERALNQLKSERIAKARKSQETEGYDAYYPLAKAICSDFRILLERIVETTFLADVVQRHRRAVNTMGKIDKLAKINKEDCDLIDSMMTKYSCYEHSQSAESPVEIPDPDEIDQDVSSLLKWHEEFSKRAV